MSDLAATILATSIAFSAFFVGYVFLLRESAKELKDLRVELSAAAEVAQSDLDRVVRAAAEDAEEVSIVMPDFDLPDVGERADELRRRIIRSEPEGKV